MEEPFDIMNFLNGFKKDPSPAMPEKKRLKSGTKIRIKKGTLVYMENSDVSAILQSEVEALIE